MFIRARVGATFRIRFKDRARSRVRAGFRVRAKVRAMVSRPRHEWTNTQIFANFSYRHSFTNTILLINIWTAVKRKTLRL